MNWDAISASAEIIGALCVIASLIYLAQQIRQNTESVRMASHQGVADQFQNTNLTVLQSAEVSEILMKASQNPSDLSDLDHFRFELFLMALFRTYEELFQLSSNGLVDEELWKCREQAMMHWLSQELVLTWWRSEQRVSYLPAFCSYIEEKLGNVAT